MTTIEPPGQADIDAIETRAHLYNLLTHQIGDDGSVDLSRAAQRSADDVPGLLAELRDLSGDLIEQGDRLRETLLKRDELRERLELAEEASDRLRAEPTPEQLAIAAVLRDLDRIEQESTADEGTHDPDCWLAHNACWAARIRRTLTREDHHV